MLQGMRANFIAHGADPVTAYRKALGAMYGLVQQHASMLAFVEAFWIMGVVFLLMLPLLPILQYTKQKPVITEPPPPPQTAVIPEPPPAWPETGEEEVSEEPELVYH